MSSLLPTPEPADPVEGQSGHFEHTNWVKAALKALDRGLLRKPAAGVPAGKILGTSATDTWSPLDPSAIGGVPAGVIVAYNGDTAPAGWAFCNGQNGTPDLRDKFILGATTPPGVVGSARGARGGVSSVTLTAEQSGIPAHTHITKRVDALHSHGNNTTDLSHAHTAWTNGGGEHTHSLSIPWKAFKQADSAGYGVEGTNPTSAWGSVNIGGTANFGGTHDHGISVGSNLSAAHQLPNTKDSAAAHEHDVNANTKANATQAHDNMPPYYALVYIIKL